jgi:MFS superfamily sulfate permease-like transporter
MRPFRSSSVLVPKLVTTLRNYDRDQFVADVGAGVVVGIVALPLAIAFAIIDLTVTVEAGMVLAAHAFMRRMAEVTNVQLLMCEFDESADEGEGDPKVFEINGPCFFGAAEKFRETMTQLRDQPSAVPTVRREDRRRQPRDAS